VEEKSQIYTPLSLSNSHGPTFPIPEKVSMNSQKINTLTSSSSGSILKKTVGYDKKTPRYEAGNDNFPYPLSPQVSRTVEQVYPPDSIYSPGIVDSVAVVDSFMECGDERTAVTIPGYVVDALPSCFASVGNSDLALSSITSLHKLLTNHPVATIVYVPTASNEGGLGLTPHSSSKTLPTISKSRSASYIAGLAPPSPKSTDVTLSCNRDDYVLGCIILLQKYLILLIVDGNLHVQAQSIEAVITYFDLLLGRLNMVISFEKEKELLVQSLIGNLSIAATSKYVVI
jgi:hypothetical protein